MGEINEIEARVYQHRKLFMSIFIRRKVETLNGSLNDSDLAKLKALLKPSPPTSQLSDDEIAKLKKIAGVA